MKKSKNKDPEPLSQEELGQRLNQCYDALYQRALELCVEHDSQIVASTMLAQALRLYKTILLPGEFDAMIKVMAETAASIEPYRTSNIH